MIDPHALTAALQEALRRAGGELRTGCAVAEVLVSEGRVGGVRLSDSGASIGADQVVIAAGVWSSSLAGIPEHARVPLRPVKGQTLRMHDPSGPGLLTRVLRMSPGYVVPRGDGRYVLGATMEERGFDTTITAGAIFEQLRDAIELVPGISELVIDGLVAGLRPGTPDNAPALGPGARGRAAMGDGSLPSWDLARADHRRGARGHACRGPGAGDRGAVRRRSLRGRGGGGVRCW